VLTRLAYSIPLLALGSYFIIIGAIFAAAAHITQYLRPTATEEKTSTEKGSGVPSYTRVCLKCGRMVDVSASFCPNCGNALGPTK
jgi:hypothetical protein